MTESTDFSKQLSAYHEQIEADLTARMDRLAIEAPEPRVVEAMRYSLLAGGKRIRPTLTLAVCEMVAQRQSAVSDAVRDAAMACAASIEMIHTYSLVHDDLPAMDNDDLRRGQATNHRRFNEYTAILAGDALLNYAYETLFDATSQFPGRMVPAAHYMAQKAGTLGMIGGQQMDLDSERVGLTRDEAALRTLQELKTGALIQAATVAGACVGGAEPPVIDQLEVYAQKLGLAFQIRDDLLDVEATEAELGKTPGKDEAAGKVTFVTLLGEDRARAALHAATQEALEPLQWLTEEGFDTAFLTALTGYLLDRTH